MITEAENAKYLRDCAVGFRKEAQAAKGTKQDYWLQKAVHADFLAAGIEDKLRQEAKRSGPRIALTDPDIPVVVDDDPDAEAVIRLVDDEDLWISLDLGQGRERYSLNIIRTDEGIVLDLYLKGFEDEGTVATTYAFDNDASEKRLAADGEEDE